MEKQVKVNINDKDYYCDSEVLKLIMRNQDKIELLEYRIDKAIRLMKQMSKGNEKYDNEVYLTNYQIEVIISILRGEDNE